jgi:DNA-binding transcriptional MerR regulator
MNGIELLKEFAKEQGIDVKEVDKFLSKWENPKTLEELMQLPHDMLNHESYITWLGEPLKSFICDDMWNDRYETIELDTVVDILQDRIYGVEEDDEISEEKREKLLAKYKEIEQYIIDTKFGSVVYDW